jgi:hypothetical protein
VKILIDAQLPPTSSCSGSSKFLGRADSSICAHADTRTSSLVDGWAPLYSQRDGRETDISQLDNTGICRLRLHQVAA